MGFPRPRSGVGLARFHGEVQEDEIGGLRDQKLDQVGVAALRDPGLVGGREVLKRGGGFLQGHPLGRVGRLPSQGVEVEVLESVLCSECRCEGRLPGARVDGASHRREVRARAVW